MGRASGAEDDPNPGLSGPLYNNGLERRVSRKSSRLSTRSHCPAHSPSPKEHEPTQHPHHAPPRSPSPQRGVSHDRETSFPLPVRRRLTPSTLKSNVAHSPLAQIYQPLVLDDVLAPEETISDNASGGGGSALLLHPQITATRRRLGSLQSMRKRPSETSLWGTRPAGSGRPTIPPLDTGTETLSDPLSTPHYREEERGMATAEQVEEIVEGNGGMYEWMKRIERIEGRQERIEELLIKLHAQLQD